MKIKFQNKEKSNKIKKVNTNLKEENIILNKNSSVNKKTSSLNKLKDNENKNEKIVLEKTGFETINEMHAIAFIVVEEKDMISFRDVLKPHRGELFETKEL